jgi:DNA-binding MarR family transcriptional regulator
MTPALIELAMRLRIAFALLARAQRREVPELLTPVQTSALYKVETYGPIRIGDLAACEQVAGPTMSRVIASLESAGLVKREQDPTSARSSCVTITPAGRKQIDAVRRDRTHVMARRLAELEPKHRRALSDALLAIEALVESVTPETGLAQREIQRTQQATRMPRDETPRRAGTKTPARAHKAGAKGAK